MCTLQQFTADHRYLKEILARQAGLHDPVLVDPMFLHHRLLEGARIVETLPIDGVLIRAWKRDHRQVQDSVRLGMRTYEIEGIRFALVDFSYHQQIDCDALSFLAVDARDHDQLRAIARRRKPGVKRQPILAADQLETLWENTIGYLEPANLERIQRYGGRPQRGILLSGSPGNGKTMACRWLCDECRDRGWEWRVVTPDMFRRVRERGDVDDLFDMADRGMIFFDDMDHALRDRKQLPNTEDQSIFLTALDGMRVKKGVVFVFTTNCPLKQIDRAFKRPGRIDLALDIREPDADMRRRLVGHWHAEIREHLDESMLVASTDGYSFAELEEIKNLLVLRFVEEGVWDWSWAVEKFASNRSEIDVRPRAIGFDDKPRAR